MFYALQAVYVLCYFLLDHEISDEQIAIAKVTCGVEVGKLEPLWMTLGVNLFSLCLVTSLIGVFMTRNEVHV